MFLMLSSSYITVEATCLCHGQNNYYYVKSPLLSSGLWEGGGREWQIISTFIIVQICLSSPIFVIGFACSDPHWTLYLLSNFTDFTHKQHIKFTFLAITECLFSSQFPLTPSWHPGLDCSAQEKNTRHGRRPLRRSVTVLGRDYLQCYWEMLDTDWWTNTDAFKLRMLWAFCFHWITVSVHYAKEENFPSPFTSQKVRFFTGILEIQFTILYIVNWKLERSL